MFNAPFLDAVADASLRRETAVSRSALWGAAADGNSQAPSAYSGGKWGGKYLRAPDIYSLIVQRAVTRLRPLSALATVEGYIHDNNTGGAFPSRRFLKSVKDAKQIKITAQSSGVVRYGVKPDGNSSLKAPILFPRTFGERHIVVWNVDRIYGKEFYKVIPNLERDELPIVAQLNSTFGILQRELLGLVNLGDGAIKFSANDVGMFQILIDIDSSRLRGPFDRMSNRSLLEIQEELDQPDRREVDSVIFDALELRSDERDEVYEVTARLVRQRLAKADSGRRGRASRAQ